MRVWKRGVLVVAILAGGLVSGPAGFGAVSQIDPEPLRAPQQEQTATEAALPLTLGDHCSRRASWNGPPFRGVPFLRPPAQDFESCRVPSGFEHEVWLLDQSNTNGLTYGDIVLRLRPE